jgi:hypothetical protein
MMANGGSIPVLPISCASGKIISISQPYQAGICVTRAPIPAAHESLNVQDRGRRTAR